jgi:SAM-dependent methyltransferase
MILGWMDVSGVSFNAILLLERCQLSWFPGWVPEAPLATALRGNPAVAWYMRHACPEIEEWLDGVEARAAGTSPPDPVELREAERAVIGDIVDLVVYAVAPEVYDAQPFLGWDSAELTSVADFDGRRVLDIGAGTGRLTFVAAEGGAACVFAVEPVGNLRRFLESKARDRGLTNVFCVDGLVTSIPFPDGFADVTMGGHVFGDDPEDEHAELVRVTKPGGQVILCPGANDEDSERHEYLLSQGFEWSAFEEPGDGMKRKYWKRIRG